MPHVSTARLVLASASLRKLRHSSAGTANWRRASTIASAKRATQTEPGLSDRSKLGRAAAPGVPTVAGGRSYGRLLSPGSSCAGGPWMPGRRGVSGAEGAEGAPNSRSTRWRSFSSSWRRIISSKALNCSCSRCRRCISPTRSRSKSSSRRLDCSRAAASCSALWKHTECTTALFI
ncbi:hypothetical protein EYF80_031614 [Liparis tanakae]|uniref:Uncharacterized protein n=1 Tax=Liparis tanakae TaxID=230148 RepID=A0A4Z2GXZ7_9TELE|nr:hypothetical protein EYF80_031614 [Liparis tanakae]